MKTFIVNVSRYKKWITLSLSILYLLLFCFPLVTFSKGYYEDASEAVYFRLPFILSLPYDWLRFPEAIKRIDLYGASHKEYVISYIAHNITCSILIFICLVLAIVCIIRQFKNKKFLFFPSLFLGFIISILSSLSMDFHGLPFTFYIFLVLLILDVVYLVLEWYYVRDGQAKLSAKTAERKAAKQAKQDAQLKQSPEYRIEQLEKELQELKAKNNENEDDRQ